MAAKRPPLRPLRCYTQKGVTGTDLQLHTESRVRVLQLHIDSCLDVPILQVPFAICKYGPEVAARLQSEPANQEYSHSCHDNPDVFDVMLHIGSPHAAEGRSPPPAPQLHSPKQLHGQSCSRRRYLAVTL
jgi:hypothetical protein